LLLEEFIEVRGFLYFILGELLVALQELDI